MMHAVRDGERCHNGGWRDANGSNNRYTRQVGTQHIQMKISIQIQSGRRGRMHMHEHVVAVTHA